MDSFYPFRYLFSHAMKNAKKSVVGYQSVHSFSIVSVIVSGVPKKFPVGQVDFELRNVINLPTINDRR